MPYETDLIYFIKLSTEKELLKKDEPQNNRRSNIKMPTEFYLKIVNRRTCMFSVKFDRECRVHHSADYTLFPLGPLDPLWYI